MAAPEASVSIYSVAVKYSSLCLYARLLEKKKRLYIRFVLNASSLSFGSFQHGCHRSENSRGPAGRCLAVGRRDRYPGRPVVDAVLEADPAARGRRRHPEARRGDPP